MYTYFYFHYGIIGFQVIYYSPMLVLYHDLKFKLWEPFKQKNVSVQLYYWVQVLFNGTSK